MMSSKKQAAVKVVIIDTQYVETDPMSFKSVVQKLTGKDSSVAWVQESNSSSAYAQRGVISLVVDDQLQDDVVNTNDHNGSMLSKGMSFKEDLDRFILEVPPPAEWQWLCTELMH